MKKIGILMVSMLFALAFFGPQALAATGAGNDARPLHLVQYGLGGFNSHDMSIHGATNSTDWSLSPDAGTESEDGPSRAVTPNTRAPSSESQRPMG